MRTPVWSEVGRDCGRPTSRSCDHRLSASYAHQRSKLPRASHLRSGGCDRGYHRLQGKDSDEEQENPCPRRGADRSTFAGTRAESMEEAIALQDRTM